MFEVLPKRGFDYSPDLLGWDIWNLLLFVHWKSFRECALCILLSTRDSDSSSFRYLTPAQERLCPKMVKIPFARFLCRIFRKNLEVFWFLVSPPCSSFRWENFDLMPTLVQVISLPRAWCIFPSLSKTTFSCQVITKRRPHNCDIQIVQQNIARVRNCPDITILNSLFSLLSFYLSSFLSFCPVFFYFFTFCLFCLFLSICLDIMLIKCLKGLKSRKSLFV